MPRQGKEDIVVGLGALLCHDILPPMTDNDTERDFSPREAQERFEAALRGARIVGHKEKRDISPARQGEARAKSSKKRKAPQPAKDRR